MRILFLLLLLPLTTLMAQVPEGTPWTVTDLKTMAVGDYLAPRYDVDGHTLWLTHGKSEDLLKVTDDYRVLMVQPGNGVGYGWVQAPTGTILFKQRDQWRRRLVMLNRTGSVHPVCEWAKPVSFPLWMSDRFFFRVGEANHWIYPSGQPAQPVKTWFAENDTLWVADAAGKHPARVSPDLVDRYYDVLPGAGEWVLHGALGGLYLLDPRTETIRHLCEGTNPAWTSDGKLLVFDQSQDDGDRITASTLWIWDGKALHRLDGLPKMAMYPSLTPDGHLVFEAEGKIIQGVVKW